MEQLVYFKNYPNEELANEAVSILEESNISSELRGQVPNLSLMGQDITASQISVYVKHNDLEKAIQVLEDFELSELVEVPKDHYLNEFTVNELLDVVKNYDEWNSIDVAWARLLLKERGAEISDDSLEKMKNKRLNELAEPEKLSLGEWNSVYRNTLILGVPGILYTWMIWFSKKKLPNGQEVWHYHEEDRSRARLVFIVSCIITIPILLVLMVYGKSWVRVLIESIN